MGQVKNIFITGGSGFLGKSTIERLNKENVKIWGLARSTSSQNKLSQMGVIPVAGSLKTIHEWNEILRDKDLVIHLAAPVEFWGSWEKFYSGIVKATEELYRASERQGVKRFIYISSESVLQDKKDLVNIDENEPYPEEPNSYYGKAKMLAEKFILAQNSSMESIILRPTFIWGKGVKALDTIVDKIKSKDFMWINQGQALFEMVHVKNVAESIYLACNQGKNKGVYFVTDNNSQPVRNFLSKLIATQGIEIPKKNIGKSLALFIANTVEWLWKTFKLKSTPPITRFDVAFVAMSRKYIIRAIQQDLGYSPIVTEEEGLREMTTR